MRREYPEDFKMRGRLLELCMEMGMSSGTTLKTVRPMDGKTPEEKEQIAEQIIQELTSNPNSEPTP